MDPSICQLQCLCSFTCVLGVTTMHSQLPQPFSENCRKRCSRSPTSKPSSVSEVSLNRHWVRIPGAQQEFESCLPRGIGTEFLEVGWGVELLLWTPADTRLLSCLPGLDWMKDFTAPSSHLDRDFRHTCCWVQGEGGHPEEEKRK